HTFSKALRFFKTHAQGNAGPATNVYVKACGLLYSEKQVFVLSQAIPNTPHLRLNDADGRRARHVGSEADGTHRLVPDCETLFAMDCLGYAGRRQESGKALVTTWSQHRCN